MKNLIIIAIRAYQWLVSPFLRALCGPGCGCRFEPSCSQYFVEAVQSHGARKGSLLGLGRLARCHPWGSYGFDPVPHSTSSMPKHN